MKKITHKQITAQLTADRPVTLRLPSGETVEVKYEVDGLCDTVLVHFQPSRQAEITDSSDGRIVVIAEATKELAVDQLTEVEFEVRTGAAPTPGNKQLYQSGYDRGCSGLELIKTERRTTHNAFIAGFIDGVGERMPQPDWMTPELYRPACREGWHVANVEGVERIERTDVLEWLDGDDEAIECARKAGVNVVTSGPMAGCVMCPPVRTTKLPVKKR